jgi:hypothetical protein
MLNSEYIAKMGVAHKNFAEKAYQRALQDIYAIDPCHCGNEDLLWMMALESYVPGSPSNLITEHQLHCLLCRMKVTGAVDAANIVVPPPPDPPPVPVTFLAEWAWMADDPYPALQVQDDIVYLGSGNFVTGGNIFADLRSAPTNSYNVIRYPLAEPAKTQWYNDVFNYGTLPDSNYREPIVLHGYRYVVSRIALTLNPAELTKIF